MWGPRPDSPVGELVALDAAGRPALFSPWNGSGTSVTVPPAAVIAASAAFDTAWAVTSSLADSSPLARTFT